MKSFSTFSFHSYSFNPQTLTASFTYRFDEEYFTETINYATPIRQPKADLDEATINKLLQHIHIAVGISYYKLSPTTEILTPDRRTQEMLNFRKKFYLNGLGELLFVNGLSPKHVANFATSPCATTHLPSASPLTGGQTFLP